MRWNYLRVVAAACLCAAIYWGAERWKAEGLLVAWPRICAQQAVQAAGTALEQQQSLSEAVEVFSDTLFSKQEDAVSVSAASEVPREDGDE